MLYSDRQEQNVFAREKICNGLSLSRTVAVVFHMHDICEGDADQRLGL